MEQPAFSYKRINHFREWIEHFDHPIPEDIMNMIHKHLEKNNSDLSVVTRNDIKFILKLNRCNKYYEYTSTILDKIQGRGPLNLNGKVALRHLDDETTNDFQRYLQRFDDQPVYDLLEDFFRKMSDAFNKGRAVDLYNGRTGFFSYSYLINKMIETINQCDVLSDETKDILFDQRLRIIDVINPMKILAMDDMWDKTWGYIDWS